MAKSTNPDKDEAVVVRPFADILREINRGAAHEELTQAMHQLTGAVNDTHKKGELILKLSLQPMKKNADVLEATVDVVTRLPRHDRKASIFYTDDNGNVSRTDPNQLAFEGIREVPPPAVASPDKQEKQA